MESVVDNIECPDCGSEAFNEFYYESGEEFITCIHCGYSRRFFIANLDEKGVKSEFEWLPDYKLEELHGYGAYKIKVKGASAYECGSFGEPSAEQEFVRLIEESKDKLAHAEYTTFKDGTLAKTIIIQEEVN